MKVCAVCNEIVSADQGCARSDCPNQTEATGSVATKVSPGFTGKVDRVVQAGLDRAENAARDATRRTAFVVVAFLLLVGSIAIIIGPSNNKGRQEYMLGEQSQTVSPDSGKTTDVSLSADADAYNTNIGKMGIEAASLHAECQSGDSASCDREVQLSKQLQASGMCLREITRYIVEWRKC